jgi:hypothetical protein
VDHGRDEQFRDFAGAGDRIGVELRRERNFVLADDLGQQPRRDLHADHRSFKLRRYQVLQQGNLGASSRQSTWMNIAVRPSN